MFEMSSLIQYRLLLILRYAFELAVNIISKRLVVFEILEKVFELRLRYWIFGLKETFILVPLLNYRFTNKLGGKKDSVWPVGLSSFKMVFSLFAKPVIIQISIVIVKIGKLGLEKLLVRCGTCLKLAIFLTFNKQF